MRIYRWLTAALLMFALPMTLAAQSDSGRISGTVRDQSSAFVADAAVTVKNDKTGETRSATTNQEGHFVVPSLKPTTYTVTVSKQGFAPIEYTQMPVAVGQELTLDFEFKPAGVAEDGHRCRHRARDRPQLGQDRRQRQRARSAGPAGQRPPDVAADAAGARLLRTREPAPGATFASPAEPSSRTSSSTTASKPPGSSTPRPAWRTAKTRASSSCRRASRTFRSSAWSPAATLPSSAPAPADR